ncbi:uncharacterized protein LOC109947242 [Prunus persica]|uniref:uncharacterized protein LOC109947242 n=1 Tax=Prunus persica TaxID=3760 RepID=UPI0009AB3794|nr:uncharacterized protein LOC109947242 [Prunus persica]
MVERPGNKPVVGVRWIFKTKLNLDGSIQKHKTRPLAKGYTQKPGVDFNKTFAPVARLDTIRTLIALAAQRNWKLFQLDVKSAFLNERSISEATLYVKTKESIGTVIVSIYVDDIVYTGSSSEMLEEFKEDMMNKYEMTDLGLLHHFLGMGVIQKEWRIFIHQQKYAKTLLDRCVLKDCKPVSTPLVPTEKLKRQDEGELVDEETYRKIVGSLLYLKATRPDIMYSTSLLARFMHGPSKKHFGAARRVLRYVQGTLDFGIEYESGKPAMLIGFCDSDWGGSEDDMKSKSGYAFSFGSGAFSWVSMKQNSVVLSIAEAGYVSAAEATTQEIWLRFVLGDFGEEQIEATPIMCDNMSTIAISKNPAFHQRSKDIGRKFHFIRDAIQGVVDLIYCKGQDSVVDIFTNALPRESFAAGCD